MGFMDPDCRPPEFFRSEDDWDVYHYTDDSGHKHEVWKCKEEESPDKETDK